MKTKLLFLDFDGVIVTPYFINNGELKHTFNKQAIHWLNKLYSIVPYSIVITSTWKVNNSLEELQQILYSEGLDKSIEIIGVTPRLQRSKYNKTFKLGKFKVSFHSQRGHEIHEWLQSFKFSYNTSKYSLTDFIILDDDNDVWEYKKHLVKCTQAGFTLNEFSKCQRKWM